MKTMLRMLVLSAGVFAVVLCMVSREEEARADVPPVAAAVAAPVPDTETAVAPAETPATPPDLTEAKPTDVILTGASTNSPTGTNNASLTNLAAFKLGTNVIMAPAIPETLQLSKPMSEVVKLVQAGVSEQVLMAFIAGAGDPFEAGSNEIIYLNDLGVSSNVITALLQHDSTPEMQARRQALGAVRPLPPGFALTSPATNIYTPKETSQPSPPVQNPPEPVPVVPPTGNAGSYAPGGTTVPTAPVYATEDVGESYDGTETTTTTVNYNYWYSNLAPYGSWVDVGGYGACWRPTVSVYNSSWRPYADCGRWLWSNSGWYWYSDYSWGWGPFHYGRWTCPPGVGWVWVPGSTWGPAWVSWRSTPSYCGWAPLPPAARYQYGSGFYYGGVSVGIGCDFGLGASAYVFLPLNRFCDRRPYNYYVSGGHGQTVYKDSTVVNNYAVAKNKAVINHGIGKDRVAQFTRGDVRQVSLKDTSSVRDLGHRREQLAADGTTLAVHRPDAPTIARIGATAPTRPTVTRPGAMRPGGAAPNQEPGVFRGGASPNAQARLTSPTVSTPTAVGTGIGPRSGSASTTRPGAVPSGTPSRPQTGQGNTFGTGTTGSEVSGGATRPGGSSIIMRNPNPNRNNANRPVTYPFVPAQQSSAAQSPSSAASRPTSSRSANGDVASRGQSSPTAPRTSFVPGPPAATPRAAYNNAPASRNFSVPAPTYSARPSYSAPAVPAPRVESSRPAASVPSPSESSGGSSGRSSGGGSSSGGRGQSSGRSSDGGSFQVGRGR